MQIRIQVKGLPGASRLRRLALDKLSSVLAHFSQAIEEASILLDDINGPDRGGADKLCRVVLRMKDSTIVIVEELGADIAKTISRAVDRLHQNLSRQMSKLLTINRTGVIQ
ncbi:MAG: hypothetical protein Q8M20_17195 [Rhodocyclaceae bacterium]|nr:hypothetical protein [Rhodocyclaceae bacterium]MDZ4215514.1 hypothetical protein [Rhodocyclaceae bacterium]